MKTFNIVLTSAFRVFLIFLLAFIWVRYYEKNLFLAVLYSSVICFVLCVLLQAISEKTEAKANLKSSELKKAENFAAQFVFGGKNAAILFFQKLFSKQFTVNKKPAFLWWEVEGKVTAFVPMFGCGKLKIRDIISAHNLVLTQKPEKIIVAAIGFERESLEFAKTAPTKFVLLDQFDVYEKLMKPSGVFPQNHSEVVIKKQSAFQSILAYALNKKRAKAWAFSGLILIFSSLFVRVSIYYLIISSLMLILAILSYTNTKYNTNVTENILN